MKRRHSFLLFSLLLSAHVTGCASHRPAPVAAIQPDSSKVEKLHLAPLPVPGFLSGLGNVFSTPQGRADRQAVRLARAAVPRSVKVKDGALAWGTYAKATNAGKKANLATDSATQQVATNAVAGRGNTARQTATSTATPGPLAVLANNLTGWIPWAIGSLLVLAVVFRKRLPIVGPFFS